QQRPASVFVSTENSIHETKGQFASLWGPNSDVIALLERRVNQISNCRSLLVWAFPKCPLVFKAGT
ncbi:MAG: hypothetical protein NXI02_27520, partial [Rhodobacteraceae bacterium]|nr:hypothetical protein [Paracoccaceae bacterium]